MACASEVLFCPTCAIGTTPNASSISSWKTRINPGERKHEQVRAYQHAAPAMQVEEPILVVRCISRMQP